MIPFARSRLVVFAALAAAGAVLAGGLVVGSSMMGWPSQLFRFTQAPPEALPEGTDIAGWASFDRDSYFIGETIRYRARILYRRDRIVPNLDTFMRSLPFFPFEKRQGFESTRGLDGDIEEYRLDYLLHGVKVEPPRTYQLDPAVVFYQPKTASAGQLQSIRIPTPAIHITEYYPRDISAIPLLALKGTIHDPARLRQWLIGVSGGILLAFAGFLPWWFARRRRADELSEPERLWREFHDIDRASAMRVPTFSGASVFFRAFSRPAPEPAPDPCGRATIPRTRSGKTPRQGPIAACGTSTGDRVFPKTTCGG
ncbi:MAG: hypothetical protein IID53_00380 [Proteobacteria bacterium]|nr:hypothetical protein [Pseudomonadota bacterium]